MINQKLTSLTVFLPGADGGDIWNIQSDNLYFADEISSNSTRSMHACRPEAMRKIVGIKRLTVGYTKDIYLVEDVARAPRVDEIIVRVCPEGGYCGAQQVKKSSNG